MEIASLSGDFAPSFTTANQINLGLLSFKVISAFVLSLHCVSNVVPAYLHGLIVWISPAQTTKHYENKSPTEFRLHHSQGVVVAVGVTVWRSLVVCRAAGRCLPAPTGGCSCFTPLFWACLVNDTPTPTH